VQNIRHVATSRGAEDSDVYAGPNFDDLDDAVTEAFLDYLEERKIDADLGYFVLAYSREKEQREYVNWLKNIQSFVTK
jgi:complement component 1 Q subcomponent-binding protein